jgi:hypothetical protein
MRIPLTHVFPVPAYYLTTITTIIINTTSNVYVLFYELFDGHNYGVFQ